MLVVFEMYKPGSARFIRRFHYTTEFDINNGNIIHNQ
jgi:hypothetical protein